MNKIKFGDQKSIDYAKAKGRIDLRIYQIHECDCEDCNRPTFECPYCDSNKEPKKNLNDKKIVECLDCDEKSYYISFNKWKDQDLIKEFEGL